MAQRLTRLGAVLLLALAVRVEAEPPTVPKLDPSPPRPAATPPDPDARALPPVTTICRDHAARRCWTEPGESTCAGTPGAAPFRIVIAAPGTGDDARALQDCMAPPAE